MLTIYWLCSILGGGCVLLSVIGGADGIDFDANGELDLELSDPGEANPSPAPRRRSLLAPRKLLFIDLNILKSFKFWTFGSCFFGLAGLLLSATRLAPFWTMAIALGMGMGMGGLAASVLRGLRRRRVNSLVQTQDWVGAKGTVELPFDAQSRGKVRLQLRGSLVDVTAFTNDPNPLNIGDTIVVIGSENNRVWVVSDATLHSLADESAPP
jgi:membrane protein implicated in regulation of membrane protease activity